MRALCAAEEVHSLGEGEAEELKGRVLKVWELLPPRAARVAADLPRRGAKPLKLDLVRCPHVALGAAQQEERLNCAALNGLLHANAK